VYVGNNKWVTKGKNMLKNTVHPEADFGKLDWSQLDIEGCTKRNWSFGYGGYGLPNEKLTIRIVDNDLDADIWVVPDAFREIVWVSEKIAREKIQNEIKRILGI
jgi:hypothetical protein